MSRYDVGSVQPVSLAASGSEKDLIVFNTGPYSVYLASSTGIAQDPSSYGIRVPPLTYKAWYAGVPLFAMCEPGETASIITTIDEGGSITPPIGQIAIDVASASSNPSSSLIPNSGTLGPFDVSRFDSFHFEFEDGGSNASGTATRAFRILWGNSIAELTGLSVKNNYLTSDYETHYCMTQGGFVSLQGKIRAPAMLISFDFDSSGTWPWKRYRLTGYTQPTGFERTNRYGYDALVGGTLNTPVNAAGSTISASVGADVFRWDIPAGAIAIATTATVWIPQSWAGRAIFGFRASAAISTNVVTVSLAHALGTSVANIDLPPTTVPRSSIFQEVFLPNSPLQAQVINNSAAAMGGVFLLQPLPSSV